MPTDNVRVGKGVIIPGNECFLALCGDEKGQFSCLPTQCSALVCEVVKRMPAFCVATVTVIPSTPDEVEELIRADNADHILIHAPG